MNGTEPSMGRSRQHAQAASAQTSYAEWRRQIMWERAYFGSAGIATGLTIAVLIFDIAAPSASPLGWVGTAMMLAAAVVVSLTDTGGKVGS